MTRFPIATLILPEPARTAAWRQWRAGLELDAMTYECQQTLPALAACLPQWLAGDDAAARIQGIVKMAWSRNQVRLHIAAELRNRLFQAGITPVIATGPLAWALITREEGAIRTIPDINLLIRRKHVFNAVSALQRDGWAITSPEPNQDTLIWSSNLGFTKGDSTLHLQWRLISGTVAEAEKFESAMLALPRTQAWKGHELQVLSPEAELLHRLTDRPNWDPVPWQADVLMMPLAEVHWNRFRTLATTFAASFKPVDVLERLMALKREWQLPIPEIAPMRARSSSLLRKISDWRSLLWRA